MKEEDTNMEIKRPAIAGTLESGDCQVNRSLLSVFGI